jgi:DNA invertase Pin-like site-specific DNA recombinase
MMLLGYCRTSTVGQDAGLEAQQRELAAAGVTKLFAEQVSSVGDRPELGAALDYLREGDVFVCTKLDRLARSVRDLMALLDRIEAKGASLRILAMNLDTGTPTGRLMLSVLGAVAAFEREIMLERQRAGIDKARAEGRYRGRKPTQSARKAEVDSLISAGVGPAEAARRLGMARSTLYRIIAGRDLSAP